MQENITFIPWADEEKQALIDSLSKMDHSHKTSNLIQEHPKEWPVNPAESAKSASDTGSPSHGPELTASLTLLAQAIEQQTKAITLLANSNQALVQAMGQAEGDEDDEPRFDLSGKRV